MTINICIWSWLFIVHGKTSVGFDYSTVMMTCVKNGFNFVSSSLRSFVGCIRFALVISFRTCCTCEVRGQDMHHTRFKPTRQQRWVQYEMKFSFHHPIFSIVFHVRLLKFVPLLSIWRHICVCGRCSFRKPVCTLHWSVSKTTITTTSNPNQQFWTNVVNAIYFVHIYFTNFIVFLLKFHLNIIIECVGFSVHARNSLQICQL